MAERNRKPDRTKNRCRACGYTWFPGSMEKAMECPRCEASDIEYGLIDRLPALAITVALGGLGLAILWTIVRIVMEYL